MSRITTAQIPTTSSLAACFVLVFGLVAASPALAQSDLEAVAAAADTLNVAAVLDSLAVNGELNEPNPAAIDVEPVDMWDTGVSATRAVLMTPLFPGWGQLYARNSWQGALGVGAEMYFWTNMLVRDRRAVRANDFGESFPVGDPTRDRYREIADENWEQMRDFAWWSGGVLLIIALDAYVGAHLFDFEADPVPVPDRWDETFAQATDSMPGSGDGLTVVVFQWRKKF